MGPVASRPDWTLNKSPGGTRRVSGGPDQLSASHCAALTTQQKLWVLSGPHALPLPHVLVLPPCSPPSSPPLPSPSSGVSHVVAAAVAAALAHDRHSSVTQMMDAAGLQQPVSLQVMPDAFRCHLAAAPPPPPQD